MKLFKINKGVIFLIFSLSLLFSQCFLNSNKNNNSNKNLVKENSSLVGGIYLKENLEKHKKTRLSNSLNLKADNSNQAAFAPPTKNPQQEERKPIDMEKVGPILHESWIKYFKYTNQALNIITPKEFIQNSDFYEQRKYFPKTDVTKPNDQGTFDFIRNKNYFYLSIFRNAFVFNSSKNVQMQRIMDSFSIADIEKVYEDPSVKSSGISDFGNFDEGFCLKISTKDIRRSIFVICFETSEEKTEIFKMVRMVKIDEQHRNGIIANNPEDTKKRRQKETLSGMLGKKSDTKISENESKLPTDGYWITLQNWSQCNLKCGGGTSTLHRMCVPPKYGGKACQGEAIINRACNTNPCPITNGTQESPFNKKNVEILKPIVKIMAFTDAPQRYTKCKIKESDMMIYFKSDDPTLDTNPLLNGKKIEGQMGEINIPSRVIMNNSTLTIYSGEHYETMYQTYNLKNTKFVSSRLKKNCFALLEGSKKTVTLCPFGCENSSKLFEEWIYDFDLFKYKCERKSPYDPKADAELQKKIQAKMNEARAAAIDEHNRLQQQNQNSRKEGDLQVLVKKTNSVAFQAIQREISLEDLIRQEEEEKNRAEEERIRLQIELEKKKKNCVLKAINEKKRENEYSLKTLEVQQRIDTIKKEAASQVLIKRNKLKALLAKIRQQSLLKRSQLNQELLNVRSSIASELGKAYKKGNIDRCIEAMKSETTKNHFCTALYVDDFSALAFCKQTDDFCNICCNSEFGDMYQNEKEQCLIKTCPKKVEEELETKDGRWIWHQPSSLN